MSKPLPWFRMYTEAVDDEKLRLLAFEDRWHFVALLCCKGMGILDEQDNLLFRKVAVKLGLDVRTLEEVARRLAELNLIDEKTLQPVAWEGRQMKSDTDATAAERKRRQRERDQQEAAGSPAEQGDPPSHADGESVVTDASRVTGTDVTRTDIDTDTDKEEDKNKDKEAARKHAAPRKRVSKADREDAESVALLIAEGVDQQHAADWIKVRRGKNLPLTQTAWDGTKLEAEKAGLTPAAAVQFATEHSWAGFRASWHANELAKESAPPAGNAGPRGAPQQGMNRQEQLEANNRRIAAELAADMARKRGAPQ
jgi:hypothetical protein